jgi:hypothetical protein
VKKQEAATSVPMPKMWPLSKIKPYPNNPRTHPPAQIKLLAELLQRYGADQPIVVDEDGVILKGHGRMMAAAEAGIKSFPVVQRTGLSATDKTAMRISDNQVALLSGWDTELIRYEMRSLKAEDYDLALLGFGDAQLVQFTTQPGPPEGGFATFGEDIPTEHECPKCKYRWSGSTKPPSTEG